MDEFLELQSQAASDPDLLSHVGVREKLKHILQLAPNHLSAKYLLASADGNARKELSAAASQYYLSIVLSHYRGIFAMGGGPATIAVTAQMTDSIEQRLSVLRPIINKDMKPLLNDIALMASAAQNVANGRGSMASLQAHVDSIESRLGNMAMDQDLMEKLVRQGY